MPERVVAPTSVKRGRLIWIDTRRRSGIDDDVQPVILHRRIEIFLDGRVQAVDFVDEKDVALLDVGEDSGEVARLFDLRAGSRMELGARRFGNQVGQRGFARPGGPDSST